MLDCLLERDFTHAAHTMNYHINESLKDVWESMFLEERLTQLRIKERREEEKEKLQQEQQRKEDPPLNRGRTV